MAPSSGVNHPSGDFLAAQQSDVMNRSRLAILVLSADLKQNDSLKPKFQEFAEIPSTEALAGSLYPRWETCVRWGCLWCG